MTSRSWSWRLITAGALLVGSYGVAVVASDFRLMPGDIATNSFGPVLRIHIVSASVALLLVPWQRVTGPRRARLRIHRWTGRAYVGVALVAGISGTVAALGTSHGPIAAAGLAALGVAWIGTTLAALQTVRRGQVAAHRRWARRSFALAFAAVTLRLYLGLSGAAGLTFDEAYPAITWLCWVPNLAVAEWTARRTAHAVVPAH